MKSLLRLLLTALAKAYRTRFPVPIVAITGSVGKSGTKEAIAAVLSARMRVRKTEGNLNNHLGVPLSIIGNYSERYYREGGTPAFWMYVLVRGTWQLFWKRGYPDVLVLEYGLDHPGDIEYLARMFAPQVAVITQIGQIPAHVEFFSSPEEVAQHKRALVERLAPTGTAVLCADDRAVLEMRSATQARVRTFGISEIADARVENIETKLSGTTPLGTQCQITFEGNTMPAYIPSVVGRGSALAASCAVLVGSVFGVGLADAVAALGAERPLPGRMRILRGVKNTTIIDDTYNSSPAAVTLALDTVRHIPAVRHVAVLGDMLELGDHSVRAHEEAGVAAAGIVDVLVTVGEQARYLADAAQANMASDRVFWFRTSQEAAHAVQELIRAGDLVLVKGSQGMRMERITEEIMEDPQRANILLVRQSKAWRAKA
jgi:UDP-N-acetylmuramoyl-tripeptide--D-alanyl-D-alanine ligase